MKVAAYQSTIAYGDVSSPIPSLREQIDRCETLGIEFLCCAEGFLGGLADYVQVPARIAVRADDGQLAALLAPLASHTVTTILGFTELGGDGRLYNSAVVWSRGAILGVYRKRHPAIRQSVYAAGEAYPVFSVGAFTFGVMICRDSVFPDTAETLVSRGAQALFVPTNNGMPASKGGPAVAADARRIDVACATRHGIPVIRANVVGECASLISYGATAIVDRHGRLAGEARTQTEELVVADLEVSPAHRAAGKE
jgi:predicted amidohydrolase